MTFLNILNNRRLSSQEQGFELLNRYSGTWVVVLVSRIKGPLSEDIVRQALDIVQRRHPRLHSRIVGSKGNLCFESEGTQKIPLRLVDKEVPWQEVVLEELNTKIESSQGLMRAVLVRSDKHNVGHLITTVHHVIIDGLSGIRLHQEILTYMQKIASGEQISQVPGLSALPPVDALLPDSMKKGFKGAIKGLLFFWRLLFKTVWYRPKTLDLEACVPLELRRCGMVHLELEVALTQQLVKTCRQKKTTVQAALCAAMLFVAAKKIRPTAVRVSCNSVVDLRKRLYFSPHLGPLSNGERAGVSDENLGVLASGLMTFHILRTNTSFWALARDVKQQLKMGLERDDIFITTLMFRRIAKLLLARPDKGSGLVTVTNVGKVNIPKSYGAYELESISFAPSMAAFGGSFMAAVTTFDEKMLINWTFSEPALSRETMEVMANEVVGCLAEVCQREDIYFGQG
jgi:NRPS condensation-like uncharacterized protein